MRKDTMFNFSQIALLFLVHSALKVAKDLVQIGRFLSLGKQL